MHDSSPPPTDTVSPETLNRLRAAMTVYLNDRAEGAADLDDALGLLAGEARDRGLPPEQLIVVLKEAWFAVPAVRSFDNSSSHAALLQGIVTMCIKQYYR